MDTIFDFAGYAIYAVMFFIALWGAFCIVMVVSRVRQKQFTGEEQQSAFLEAIEEPLAQGNYDGANELCEGDRRACLLYTSPSPRDQRGSRMPSSA